MINSFLFAGGTAKTKSLNEKDIFAREAEVATAATLVNWASDLTNELLNSKAF